MEKEKAEEFKSCTHRQNVAYFCKCNMFICEECKDKQHSSHFLFVKKSHLVKNKVQSIKQLEVRMNNMSKTAKSSFIQFNERIKIIHVSLINEFKKEFEEQLKFLEVIVKADFNKILDEVSKSLQQAIINGKNFKEKISKNIQKIPDTQDSVHIIDWITNIDSIEKEARLLFQSINLTEAINGLNHIGTKKRVVDINPLIESVEKEISSLAASTLQVPLKKQNNLYFVNSTSLFVFDAITLQKLHVYKHYFPFIENGRCVSILLSDNRFFITALSTDNYKFVFEYDSQNQNMIKRADMHTGRHRHALCEIKPGMMLASGGTITNVGFHYLESCEVYNANTNIWITIASLNEARCGHTSFSYKEEYVYVFNGHINGFFIERLNLNNFNGGWEEINVANVPNYKKPCENMASLKISAEEILIIGGTLIHSSASSDCAIYNCKTNQIKLFPHKLVQPEVFEGTSMCSVIPINGHPEYLALSSNGNLHIFDGSKWKFKSDFIK